MCGSLLCLAFLASSACAETGAEAWLRYVPLEQAAAQKYLALPASVVVLGDSPVLGSAKGELIRGVRGMLGREVREEKNLRESAIVLGTLAALRADSSKFLERDELHGDGFLLAQEKFHGVDCLIVTAATDRGVLYGVFALLSKIARGENVSALRETQQPFAPIRWVDDWDNLDGRIERGYAGPSIFFENGS